MPIEIPELTIHATPQNASPDAKIDHLTKVVRVLWHEVVRMRRYITFDRNEIAVKNGSASIVLKQDGSIIIRGNNITIEGASRVNIKASADIVLKAANIRQN